ncbi:hypothetical protein D3C87_1930860 [compost metagenome]
MAVVHEGTLARDRWVDLIQSGKKAQQRMFSLNVGTHVDPSKIEAERYKARAPLEG